MVVSGYHVICNGNNQGSTAVRGQEQILKKGARCRPYLLPAGSFIRSVGVTNNFREHDTVQCKIGNGNKQGGTDALTTWSPEIPGGSLVSSAFIWAPKPQLYNSLLCHFKIRYMVLILTLQFVQDIIHPCIPGLCLIFLFH